MEYPDKSINMMFMVTYARTRERGGTGLELVKLGMLM